MEIQLQLAALCAEAEAALAGVASANELADLMAKYLGKKGPFAEFMMQMKALPKRRKSKRSSPARRST